MPLSYARSPETLPRLASNNAHGLVGESPQMDAVRRSIEKIARHRHLPVLLLGQTGTGKELVAQAIHNANPRGNFVVVDCASLSPTVIESELFGHVKGAFTGATENKRGLVELADGGTAFFDEIGELPIDVQAKLLRLLQEREFRPVGAPHWRRVDIRVIAATNRDLKTEVTERRFREDLYHRLKGFTIRIPPLSERKRDITLLIEHFLRRDGLPEIQLSSDVFDILLSYDWPGNVRELKNCIEGIAAWYSEGEQSIHLPSAIQEYRSASRSDEFSEVVNAQPVEDVSLAPKPYVFSIRQCEQQAIAAALKVTEGEREKAARILKIGRTTLYRKMKQYGIG